MPTSVGTRSIPRVHAQQSPSAPKRYTGHLGHPGLVLSRSIHQGSFVRRPAVGSPDRDSTPADRRSAYWRCSLVRTPPRHRGADGRTGRHGSDATGPTWSGRASSAASCWSPSGCPTSTCRGSPPWCPRIHQQEHPLAGTAPILGVWLPHGNWSTSRRRRPRPRRHRLGPEGRPSAALAAPRPPGVGRGLVWTVSLTLIDGIRCGAGSVA